MASIEIFDPTGTINVKKAHAKRLDTLAGRRIGVLTNEQWQAYFALPRIQAEIEADFPGSVVLPIETFPKGNDRIGSAEVAQMVKDSGVDAVIIGNAA